MADTSRNGPLGIFQEFPEIIRESRVSHSGKDFSSGGRIGQGSNKTRPILRFNLKASFIADVINILSAVVIPAIANPVRANLRRDCGGSVSSFERLCIRGLSIHQRFDSRTRYGDIYAFLHDFLYRFFDNLLLVFDLWISVIVPSLKS